MVTDAWEPQTNGVVRTLQNVIARLRDRGMDILVVEPGAFRTFPCPGYPEVRLVANPWRLGDLLERWAPDMVHLATEGPLGLAARAYLTRRRLSFTTSLHTKFPEYVSARLPVPVDWGYAYLRWFHRPAARVLVTTESHRRELEDRHLSHLVVWGRGVDTELFRPMPRAPRSKPRLLYVGRVSVEKNVEAFLELDVDAEKIVVGDGPQRAELERRYPSARWLGYLRGPALVRCYADADVFVFPSRTDTFGLVMLEAMACGTPVAAYPVTGPVDVVTLATGRWPRISASPWRGRRGPGRMPAPRGAVRLAGHRGSDAREPDTGERDGGTRETRALDRRGGLTSPGVVGVGAGRRPPRCYPAAAWRPSPPTGGRSPRRSPSSSATRRCS